MQELQDLSELKERFLEKTLMASFTDEVRQERKQLAAE